MNILQNAHIVMAGLHCLNAIVNLGIERHNKGEHVTFGDVANVIADELPAAVKEAGIEDHAFRVHPHLPPPMHHAPGFKLPGKV